jgi:hypothetical protein
MAKIEKKTKRYPSDLTDEEWARVEPFLPRASKAGRPIEVDLREVLNAIRYMARSGGELCRKIGDDVNQAADLISATASIPSLNFIPLTTFGNWF